MITLAILGILLLPFLLIGGGVALFWKKRRRSVLRWLSVAYIILVAAVILGVGPYLAAWALAHSGTRPPDRALKDTPADFGVVYEDVVFEARDSVRLSGWLIPPSGRNTIIICTHGLFRNRVEVLSRIAPVAKAGYGALLYDSRSHGESEKALVSLGYHERNDVLGALQYVRSRFQDSVDETRVVLMGVSMGAVATLEAASESRGYHALIVDSPFTSLRDTVVHHSWMFLKMPRYPFPSIFLFWFQQLAGVDTERVDTRNALKRIEPVPMLFITSEGDERIGMDTVRALYVQANTDVKKLEVFGKDVPHGASARLYPEAYASLVVNFLEQSLAHSEPPVSDAPDLK